MSAPEFITITLNPALDETLVVEGELALGRVHAVRSEIHTAGGKGVNVAKMLAANGRAVSAGGLLGADQAAFYDAALTAMGISCRFLTVPQPTRRNTMLTDDHGRELKYNRPGFPELAFDPNALAAYFDDLVAPGCVVILSGSLPARFPADTYARFIPRLRAAGCVVGVDTSGPALAAALTAQPDVIKPNRRELEAVRRETLDQEPAMRRALTELMTAHEVAIVSDGARGAWFASQGQILFAGAPRVKPVDTTGAGDTLLGQFCADYFPARRLTAALAARAVAAGAAAVQHRGTPLIPPPRPGGAVTSFQ